jgi:GNAT superfamily N-acetyltransferase
VQPIEPSGSLAADDAWMRAASEEDAAALAALINDAYRVERHFVRGDRLDPRGVLDHMQRGSFLVRDGREPRQLDACIYLEPRGATGYLGLLSVAPGVQGCGLGERVLRAGEEWLARQGARQVEIRVVNLRHELFPWYRKRGYQVLGALPFTDTDRLLRPCHFVVMGRPLTS